MNRLSVNSTNSLTAYIQNLDEKATKLDKRCYPFVPPAGRVLTISCDHNHHARIFVADGLGGKRLHVMPTGVFFTCRHHHEMHQAKPVKPWRFTSWLEKMVGIKR